MLIDLTKADVGWLHDLLNMASRGWMIPAQDHDGRLRAETILRQLDYHAPEPEPMRDPTNQSKF